jgi:cell division protein ZapD
LQWLGTLTNDKPTLQASDLQKWGRPGARTPILTLFTYTREILDNRRISRDIAFQQPLEYLVPDLIIYEHPLNERVRTFLRLEHLFERMAFHQPSTSVWSSRAAVDSLLDIISIFSRGDVKMELLKELERQTGKLTGIQQRPGVDMQTLGRVLDNLENATNRLHRLHGQVAQQLRENEFLKTITQRSSIPGGSCVFDLPHYHFWLQQPTTTRQQQLQDWVADLEPIRDATVLVLGLIRGSTTATMETAQQGFFQHTLDSQSPAQLIRVGLDAQLPLFAEVSGGKHRFNIRFIEAMSWDRPTPTRNDVLFSLTCCVI